VGAIHCCGPNSYILSLASDSSGQPGAALETISVPFVPSLSVIVTAFSSSHPALSAGSTYWVVMAATNPLTSFAIWDGNNQGINGGSVRDANNGFTWTAQPPGSPSPAVEVNASAIPEPATIGLSLVGLAALVLLRRKALRAV
jgi:hypothetical protein